MFPAVMTLLLLLGAPDDPVGTGADDSVEAIEIRKEGGILVGGKFKSYNGHVSYGLGKTIAAKGF